MIARNIDILTVALLLMAAALCSSVRNSVVIQRQVWLHRPIIAAPVIPHVPAAPKLPRILFD